MDKLDWIVLVSTLAAIVIYGIWKTRKRSNLTAFLRGDGDTKWGTIGLSIMATQASAITFLSTPGLAYEEGMGFLQFYFGLPIAMIILSVFVLPRYFKAQVFTAYEYLEARFDLKIRLLTAFLFLVQRGLAAGITIYAPAIVLSAVLGWDLSRTVWLVGALVIVYTVTGGSKAVSITQKWQMAVILLGMTVAFVQIFRGFQDYFSMDQALEVAGSMGRMEVISFQWDPSSRYTFWSGIFGGVFLFLSYFGTDQSQVQRYLTSASLDESRFGLLFNGAVKIPMQFFVLLTGVMLFVFYQIEKPPLFFNETSMDAVGDAQWMDEYQQRHDALWEQKRAALISEPSDVAQAAQIQRELEHNRQAFKEQLATVHADVETKDGDYIFIGWILKYMPHGWVGLLIAVMLSAAMSSTAGEINALASTTVVDFYQRLGGGVSESKKLWVGRAFTLLWGFLALLFALYAQLFENLIEAVNLLGSLFYGAILAVFFLAFLPKRPSAASVFGGVVIGELVVLGLFFFYSNSLGFLWYNFIGLAAVIFHSLVLQFISRKKLIS